MKNFMLGLFSGSIIIGLLTTIGFSSLCQEDPETTVKFYASLF